MKIAVLGAGIIGVTTAYALAREGHQVTIIDRQNKPANETSYANGGQIAATHTVPWGNPKMPLQVIKWMLKADAPLLFKPLRWDPELWQWGVKFLSSCTKTNSEKNFATALSLAQYSKKILNAYKQKHYLQYNQLEKGILYLYRNLNSYQQGVEKAHKINDLGLPQKILTKDEVIGLEPELKNSYTTITGGVLSPDDESGDARLFALELSKIASEAGVEYLYNTHIKSIRAHKAEVLAVDTERGSITADAFVSCLACDTYSLFKPLQLKVPIYPAKGYSISASMHNPSKGPARSITDESNFIVITPLGDQLRAAGTAEMCGYDRTTNLNRVKPILNLTKGLFPYASEYKDYKVWTGLRPTTPDSIPIVGATKYSNLFINSGHGTLGWTMACGSAQIIADLISNNSLEIDIRNLSLTRFNKN